MVVANRLPVDRITQPDGSTGWRVSPGGLVTALEPIMRANEGLWIGWPGGTDVDVTPFEHDGMTLDPIAYVNLIRRSMRGRKWQRASSLS